jgi:hypothetical protein
MQHNSVITTHLPYDAEFALWTAHYELLKVSLVYNGFPEDKYACLEPLCQSNFIGGLETERRKHKWVKFYQDALGMNADMDTMPNVCSCDPLVYTEMNIPI